MDISIYELFFFILVACAWPISIWRMIKNKSTKGKSLLFSCIILLGYVFGIAHKLIYDLDFVIYVYILNVVLVSADIIVFFAVKNKYEKEAES